jgi:hypothetical protein
MDARTLKGYAGAVTALAIAGSWFAISGNPFPQASPEAVTTTTAAPVAVVQTADPAVAHDLTLARAYRDAAAKLRGDTSRRVEAAAAAPQQVVTITQAPPVAATRSS